MYLLIDSNFVCHRTKYILQALSYADRKTGIVFSFLNHILYLFDKFSTNKFIFAWDSRLSKRKEIFPKYKAFRIKKDKTKEERTIDRMVFRQMDELRDYVLPRIGFKNIFQQEGYEADDVIAKIVIDNHKKEDIIVVSNDNDLYQLLDYCSIYDLHKKQLLTKQWFLDQYGLAPPEWIEVKGLAGCTSDGIPGIKGIGEKTALKYLLRQLPEKSKAYKSIVSNEGRKVSAFTQDLVSLPYPGTNNFEIVKDEFSLGNFMDICGEYGLNSFLSKNTLNKWKQFFGGTFNGNRIY